jgi:hypothetical protein
MPPTNTSYDVAFEMSVKLNSLSNILHKVSDQIMVLPCWLDLPTHITLGVEATRWKLGCK